MPTDRHLGFDDLEDILDLLPEELTPTGGTERRKHNLTREDLILISKLFSRVTHSTCNMGLTVEEVGILKRILAALNKGVNVTANVIWVALIGAFLSFLVWSFWHRVGHEAAGQLLQGATKAIGK